MDLAQVERGLSETRRSLAFRARQDGNILVGIGGPVACGKSWLSRKVWQDIQDSVGRQIIYLPFDLWINGRGNESLTYAGRFALDDFRHALDCIRKGEPFFVPRYDITKWSDSHEECPTVPMKPETVQRLNLVYNSDKENCTCQTKRPFKPVMTAHMGPQESAPQTRK